jgi:drug/metabolite transporter (DMT)-like permease
MRDHRGEVFAALAAIGFGSAYVATSFALTAFAPLPTAAWRSFLAAIAVGVVMVGRGLQERASADRTLSAGVGARTASEQPGAGSRMVRLLVLALLAGPLFLASMNLAIAYLGAAIAAFVAGLYAVTAAVVAPALLPERLTLRVLAGFVLALLGTALLAELNPDATDVVGMGWGILAAVSFALYLVLARRWSVAYRLDGLSVAFSRGVVTALVLGGFVVLTDPGSLVPADPSAAAVIAIAWLTVVSALSPILTIASARLIPVARSAAFLLLNPITATVLAVVLLGERPSPLELAGGLLVLLGMAVATIPGGRPLRSGSPSSP